MGAGAGVGDGDGDSDGDFGGGGDVMWLRDGRMEGCDIAGWMMFRCTLRGRRGGSNYCAHILDSFSNQSIHTTACTIYISTVNE